MEINLGADEMDYHDKTAQEAISLTGSLEEGLSGEEARRRLLAEGGNLLEETRSPNPLFIFFSQFKNALTAILIIAVILSWLLGHFAEAAVICVIILFSAILGFFQEFRSERAIAALRHMAAPKARVLRDGEKIEIPASELVCGDIITLEAGDRVPADGRLIYSVNLSCDEAALTGESMPAEKDHSLILPAETLLGDRRNMAFCATTVSRGRGSAVVTATGMKSQFGKIAGMLTNIEQNQTPLQKGLDRAGKALAKAALAIIALIVAAGLFYGQPLVELFIFAIALAVAAVPEALPAVVTISLALGVQRMAKKNALMRNLPSVETLGSTTVICTDKTGTLTKGEMTVREGLAGGREIIFSGGGYRPEGKISPADGESLPSQLEMLLTAALLCNDAKLEEKDGVFSVLGDPTEGALLVAARKFGLLESNLRASCPRLSETPFSSETKTMATLNEFRGRRVVFLKGAPEKVLGLCNFTEDESGLSSLGEEGKKRLLERAEKMAGDALRVLGFAAKESGDIARAANGMTFLGFLAMQDPPRAEAAEAVRKCVAAGIRPVMITGDHPLTAAKIAREVGILNRGLVMTGADLEAANEEELCAMVGRAEVFARVSPEHKLRIVEALRKNGEIVAMTGDGVNDAPALKKADIGISMGLTGADVTREASSMTLLDDSFSTIVDAVQEGRIIYDNIGKYLKFLISSNIGEVGLMAVAVLFGFPPPLSAVQLLYVNLATDGLPALALAVDPPESCVMSRPPRDPAKGVFTREAVVLMVAGGIWSAIVNFSLFYWEMKNGPGLQKAMTITFLSLVLIQFFKAYSFRSEERGAWRAPLANKWLNRSVLWELFLMALVIYLPALQKPFSTISLTPTEILFAGAASFSVIPVLETVKMALRKRGSPKKSRSRA